MKNKLVLMSTLLWGLSFGAGMAFPQSDPGVRGGPPGAGGALVGLNSNEVAFFNGALKRFQEVDSVRGTLTDGSGLGPRFNADSCATCHAQPAVGGTSPVSTNPQVALATEFGARNTVPSFIFNGGPVREARFILQTDSHGNLLNAADGGVHDLYVITGRSDATNQPNPDGTKITCNISQPNFNQQLNNGNVIFRIPTPVFGGGLVEGITDTTLQVDALQSGSQGVAPPLFNRNGNDGSITRFGWKAQNKSLTIFTGEAYNVEQGVTNELFPQEREENANCQFNTLPEDHTTIGTTNPQSSPSGQPGLDFGSDVLAFASFARLSEPPHPAAGSTQSLQQSIARGQQDFIAIGCALCHVQSHAVGYSQFTGQNHRVIQPWSDFGTHLMGDGLYDGVTQGIVGTEHFRTAPLWGLGQRAFFLHDGSCKDLLCAIEAHESNNSEASQIEINFDQLLTPSQQQDVLNFLRSL
jgi:CxxC motif-containing protein (DUF1111 family)